MPKFDELFAAGGHAREHMRGAPNGGPWVDSFCDELVSILSRTKLEDLTLTYGAAAANVVPTERGVQLNVRWSRDGGWQCFTAPDYDSAIRDMWASLHRVAQSRKDPDGIQV